MKEKNSSKQVLLSVLGVAILVVAVVGVSFAAFSYSKTGEKVNTITTGSITMNYAETTNGINLTNALPMSDEQGKALSGKTAGHEEYFDFTVSANITGTTTIDYVITATKEPESTLPDTAVKVYLTDMDSSDSQLLAPTKVSALPQTNATDTQNTGAPADQYKLHENTFTSTNSRNYRLRMWVADDYTGVDTAYTYKLRVNVYGAAAAA